VASVFLSFDTHTAAVDFIQQLVQFGCWTSYAELIPLAFIERKILHRGP